MGQSNAEACSQVSCSPRDWPDDMIQKLATINQHHVWNRWSNDRDTDRLDEHGLVTLPQTAILIDQGWRDWTQFKLEDISYINVALLPHDYSRLNSVSMSYMAFPLTVTAFLSDSIVLTIFFIVLWNSLLSEMAIADVIDTWLLVIEGMNVLLQLYRDLFPIGLVQSPSSLSFLLVFILLLPIYCAMWLLLHFICIVHMFNGDVKVGARTETIHPHSYMLGAR